MDDSLFGIAHLDVYLVIGILSFFIILEISFGFLKNTQRTSGDWIQEAGSYLILALIIKPGIVLSVFAVGSMLYPTLMQVTDPLPYWLSVIIFILVDDFMQYWYHRSAHEYSFLWKLHRPHHQAEEMGFFVSYRNAALYYIFMPNIWWIAIYTFLGGATAVALGLVLKQLIIISSHSQVKYDSVLYRSKLLSPIATLIEHIFVTPAFHHAHHGKSKLDGISDPNSNFGNMLSIWDQIFGTAFYSRKFPEAYGLLKATKDHWSEAYLYPFLHSKDKSSEISKDFVKSETSYNEPSKIELEKNTNYLWCQCGMSRNQPFCDGTHHGTKHRPILFEVKRSGAYSLCNCKKTKSGPFCDDAHLQ